MPTAVAVPLALAGASLISGNANQKAADKNNQNQQTSELANSQAAWNTARANFNDYNTANPNPFAGAAVARPNAGGQAATTGANPYQGSPQPATAVNRILSAGQPGTGTQLPISPALRNVMLGMRS